MSSINTINSLSQFCKDSTGDTQKWTGKNGTYFWNTGRENSTGLVNGVVRKLAGIDAGGVEIWVVAGSFKIAQDGEILRFTGIPKKTQLELAKVYTAPVQVTTAVTQVV